jgi:hypothetical protein
MANRLTNATSLYLLQHAENPVDWWEWGPEAFAEAKRRDAPILLSIGYAACHWCHVMAHESFEDPGTAEVMNAGFVSIKVDREERPDVDAVYMAATTALTGHGGWPMTVFLDHERRPFYAGTYYPPHPRPGMPSLRMVLDAVSAAWRDRRAEVEVQAGLIGERLASGLPAPGVIGEETSAAAASRLRSAFDAQWGGFGGAPKFPQPMVHEFLLRHHARTGDPEALAMVERTLTAMAAGGMYDQLVGGFCRYSVDARWLVPHFEKMLYDNALLLRLYLHWWRETGSDLARRVVEETAEFLLAELRTDQGGFAASLDADSEGREGAYYVWTPDQVRAAGGDPAMLGVTDAGTFEHGTSVILRPEAGDWPRAGLREARALRPRPARDDKVVLAWNAWAVQALAEAGGLLGRADWIDAAVACRDLLWDVHADGDRLYRVSHDGRRGDAAAVLEDHASLALAEFTLAAVRGGQADRGHALVARLADLFLRPGRDTTADDLPATGIDMTDNATPSGWSLAAEALLVSASLRGEPHDAALDTLARAARLADHPQFWGHGLSVLEAVLDGPVEAAVAAAPGAPIHHLVLGATRPGVVVALGGPLLAGRDRRDGQDTVYVCRGSVCDAPTTDADVLAAQLRIRVRPVPASPASPA